MTKTETAEPIRCVAMVHHRKRTVKVIGGMQTGGPFVPCGLPIEGYGACSFCGLAEVDHGDPMDNRHPYQPSWWRHVNEGDNDPGIWRSREAELGHPATPPAA